MQTLTLSIESLPLSEPVVKTTVHVHELVNGRYVIKPYELTDGIPVGIFDDCTLTLPEVLAGT